MAKAFLLINSAQFKIALISVLLLLLFLILVIVVISIHKKIKSHSRFCEFSHFIKDFRNYKRDFRAAIQSCTILLSSPLYSKYFSKAHVPNKLDNLDEIDKLLKRYKLPKNDSERNRKSEQTCNKKRD